MSEENRQTLTISEWTGGWNTRDSDHDIADNQLAAGSQNVRIHPSKIAVRPGYDNVGSGVASTSVTGIYDGKNHLLVTYSDGSVRRLSGTTYASVAAATSLLNALVDFASLNGLDVMVDGTNVKKWNGTTFADLGGTPPASSMVEVYMNHLFLATTASSLVTFSNQEDPETYSAAFNTFEVEKNSNEVVRGMKAVFDRLLIWKSKSIHHIAGYDILSFERIRVSQGVGCASDQSIVLVQNSPTPEWNGLYWVDQGGIYFSPDLGATCLRISDTIQSTFDALDQTALNVSVGLNVRKLDEVWFSLRASGSFNNRVLAWNYRLGTWHPIYTGMNFRACGEVSVSGKFLPYFGEADSSVGGEVYEVATGTNDNGAAISFKAVTKRFFFGNYRQANRLRKLGILQDKVASQNLTVNTRINFSTTTDETAAVSMSSEEGTAWYNRSLNGVQFELVQETLDAATAIRELEVEYLTEDLR